MKISLILATINRTEENERFIRSLDRQDYRNIELIIVDQNCDDRLIPLIKEFKESLDIIHVRSNTGLSRARNVGISYCSGDIVAFPDDDCWYPPELISKIISTIKTCEQIDVFTCQAVDESYRTLSRQSKQDVYEILKPDVIGKGIAISFCLFFRKSVVDKVGQFDEEIGVGADTPYGAGEESDYLYRALDNGFRVFHFPEFKIFHPRKSSGKGLVLSRAAGYGFGIGYVMRCNKVSFIYIMRLLLRRILRAFVYILRLDVHNFLFTFMWSVNLLKGWASISYGSLPRDRGQLYKSQT